MGQPVPAVFVSGRITHHPRGAVTRILVLPGIGDIYWVAVALQSFAKQHGLEDLELTVWDFDGRRRSAEYVERIPFVRCGGYFNRPPHPHKLPAFRQSYLTGECSVFPGLFGFDLYMAANGALRTGYTVEEAFGVECDWYFDLTRTQAEGDAEVAMRQEYGPYIVTHFSEFGMFTAWVRAWGVDKCAALLTRVHAATGCTMLLTGCDWDRPFAAKIAAKCPRGVVDLTGDTNPDTFFGMLRGAAGVLGWCGGNTILATALRIPTLIAWSRAFPDARFFRNACPPDAIGNHYAACVVEAHTPAQAERMFLKVFANHYPGGVP